MNSLRHIAMAFALVLLAGFALQAQDGKLKKANELYDGYSFPEAAEAYKKILSKESHGMNSVISKRPSSSTSPSLSVRSGLLDHQSLISSL